jgi:hypothetical protein
VSHHTLPIGVPCAVCMSRINRWTEDTSTGGDDIWQARPCGHFLHEINNVLARVPRARFGQYTAA